MAKKADRARNWRKYNEALVKRGDITFWFSEDAIQDWHNTNRTSGRGRPQKYSDLCVICGLTLKVIFNLTFRSVEGFIRSLIRSLKLNIDAPDYTLLCKRQKNLNVELLNEKLRPGEKIHILVDTSGLKVFGEGEWKVRQHGHAKRRVWRKLHLAVNSESQAIEAFELTELGVQDCQGFGALVNHIDKKLAGAVGDGAYDRFSCYEVAEQKGFELITPPQHNARPSRERSRNKKKASPNAVKKRDGVIDRVREIGSKAWKVEVGYHRRSLAETAMFRWKTLLGNKLYARKMAHQITEVAIKSSVLNKMIA
jgi:hypothetical protein